MSNKDNNILKCNYGEKYMKVQFIIYAVMESVLEKMRIVIIILKNHQQLKSISIDPLVIHCLHIVHLIIQKIILIIIELKTV